jgi:hypothetical protein
MKINIFYVVRNDNVDMLHRLHRFTPGAQNCVKLLDEIFQL